MSLLIACCCGEIVAGGAFTAPGAGGGNLRRVARWNGSSWDEVGARTANTTTWSFGTYVNELYAGDSGDNPDELSVWNGTAWVKPETDEFEDGGTVRALVVHDGKLAIGGAFTDIGGAAINRVAYYNGSAYSQIGGGIDDVALGSPIVISMVVYDGDLIAAGIFDSVEGGTGVEYWIDVANAEDGTC